MCSGGSDTPSRVPGFPIRISPDQCLVDGSPELFAVTHVLHRLQAPRHPPLALCSLENKDARARSEILKGREPRTPEAGDKAGVGGLQRDMGAPSAPRERNRGSPDGLAHDGEEAETYDCPSRGCLPSSECIDTGVPDHEMGRAVDSLERR